MDDYDLNIENYNLDDILSLFHIDYNFTQDDLAAAKKRALLTHPDKSGLDQKYFIFFQSAYKILHKIYYFRFRQKKNVRARDTIELPDDQRVILERLKNKKTGEFNKWFNEMFEKVKIKDDTDMGYDAWLRSDDDIHEMARISLSQFDNEFDKVKQKCKSQAIITSVGEMGGDLGYSLTREKPQSFSSGVFSQLKYEDLKKAHTESVVPVTKEDYLNVPKFSNVDSYRSYRDAQNIAPPSLQQSREFLANKMNSGAESDTRRIYKILKQDEKIKESNEKWWSSLKHLTN